MNQNLKIYPTFSFLRYNSTQHNSEKIKALKLINQLTMGSSRDHFRDLKNYMEYIFENGSYSDVVIRAFETEYYLHRVMIMRASFFYRLRHKMRTAEGRRRFQLDFSHDSNITQSSFDLVLKFLYGIDDYLKITSFDESISILATADYMNIPDMVDRVTDKIVSLIDISNLERIADLYQYNIVKYGSLAEKLKNLLCFHLFSKAFQSNHDVPDMSIFKNYPTGVLLNVLASDKLNISSERNRLLMLINYYKHKSGLLGEVDLTEGTKIELKRELFDIKNSLNKYTHFGAISMTDLLDYSSAYKDVDGNRLLNWAELYQGFWLSAELAHHIKSTTATETGLVVSESEREKGVPYYHIPDDNDGSSRLENPAEEKWTKFPPCRFRYKTPTIVDIKTGPKFSRCIYLSEQIWLRAMVAHDRSNDNEYILKVGIQCLTKDCDEHKTEESDFIYYSETKGNRIKGGSTQLTTERFQNNRSSVLVYFRVYVYSSEEPANAIKLASPPVEFEPNATHGWEIPDVEIKNKSTARMTIVVAAGLA